MGTFLFVWNPIKWEWKTIEKDAEEVRRRGKMSEEWSCQSYKMVKPGDRAFLVRVGAEPKGIFAAGRIVSEPFLAKHWSGRNREGYRVKMDLDVLLNPEKEPILSLDILKVGSLARQMWTPQASGISIKPELVEMLEAVWADFLVAPKSGFEW